ncbi:uncharacterized protein LOC121753156 isoform X2 [Salvia splendens]|uniref:uncharacterized protein LOC121753156 isoform X2 n=1 Tax=Salvia splendens TaxID=180675 RepID=UPI001C26EE63|nr:uncharacterized protein LOC121753156 isoform X2 [Salvia splendens]
MDLKLFKLDIDELIHEFTQCESSAFAEFKRVWLSRRFSYIFESAPSTNQGLFMQSLYAHSISYMVSADSFFNRLGGLFCLYYLFETQLFKPPYKIYLSLEELKQLKNLVIEAKAGGVNVVGALVKGMLERNMFLFGFVGVDEGSPAERVNEVTGYLLTPGLSTSSTWTWAQSLTLIFSKKDRPSMQPLRSLPSKRLAKWLMWKA